LELGELWTADNVTRRLGVPIRWRLVEYRGDFAPLREDAISKADALNGVQLRYKAYLRLDAYRYVESVDNIVDQPSWTGWVDANPEKNPVLVLAKIKNQWSVRFTAADPTFQSMDLLGKGVFTNPEALDDKITCAAAAGANPFANYRHSTGLPRKGQFFCPGAVLTTFPDGPDRLIATPTQIDEVNKVVRDRLGLKGDQTGLYGIKRGHAEDACAGSPTNPGALLPSPSNQAPTVAQRAVPAKPAQLFVCPGMELYSRGVKRRVDKPIKIERAVMKDPDGTITSVALEGGAVYVITTGQPQESCAAK